MPKVFFRCARGHYFQDTCCPWDGWSHPGFDRVVDVLDACKSAGKEPTISLLRAKGIEDDVLRRVLVVDFGDERAAFDAVSPKQLMIDDALVDLEKLDERFL